MDNWYITPGELEMLRLRGDRLYIVDIRDNNKYKKGHIRGAVNMPADENDDLPPRNENIVSRYVNAGYIVVLYCTSGIGAMRCVRNLRRRGITAYNLYGGIKEYVRIKS